MKNVALNFGFQLRNRLYEYWFRWRYHPLLNSEKFEQSLSGNRVVVLAPHIDDDIIGCGGAIIKYTEQNVPLHIVYLTDGRKSKAQKEGQDIREIRMQEAYNAAKALALPESRLHFLSAPDQQLIGDDILLSNLSELLQELAPDTIFAPVFMDTHPDHFAATSGMVLARNPELQNIYLYEVQSPITPIYANIMLDITGEFPKKSELVSLYQSQKMDFSFVRRQNSFNARCLSSGKKPCKFAELFIWTSPDQLVQLISDLGGHDYRTYKTLCSGLIGHGRPRTFMPSMRSSVNEKGVLSKLCAFKNT